MHCYSKQSIRILHVVDDFSEGGAAVVVDNLLKGLSKEFVPVICCLDAVGEMGEKYKRLGVLVVCVNRSAGVDKSLFKKIRKIIKEYRIDIIHAHQYTAFFYSLIASLFMIRRPKMVFTEHGRHFPDAYRWKRAWINQILHYFTYSFVAVSEAVKESLVVYEKFPSKKINVILNGIDVGQFHGVRKESVASELGISKKDCVIGSMSRMIEAKNHQMILKCFPKLLSKVKNVKLVLVGDGEFRKELEALAAALGITDRVIFTGARGDIPDLLGIFDVVVLLSFYEGTSMTLLEAMASGIPVIASNVAGNPFIVRDGENGFLVPIEEENILIQRLTEILLNDELNKKMGKEAKRDVAERFGLTHMAAQYTKIYENAFL